LVEIRKAAEQQDATLLRKAILQWADLHHERGFSSLEALARVSTEPPRDASYAQWIGRFMAMVNCRQRWTD
jgi:hypothetical protein